MRILHLFHEYGFFSTDTVYIIRIYNINVSPFIESSKRRVTNSETKQNKNNKKCKPNNTVTLGFFSVSSKCDLRNNCTVNLFIVAGVVFFFKYLFHEAIPSIWKKKTLSKVTSRPSADER